MAIGQGLILLRLGSERYGLIKAADWCQIINLRVRVPIVKKKIAKTDFWSL